ncbi:MAG TPA: glutamate synthase [Polyangia bacterium]|nr:glutamate synthase [Polyangia bacterium]
MAELRPIPFAELLERVLVEPARQESLFDLPLRKIWRPRADLDLSVDVHGHRAQSPVGPAAGPHAQLAQNIVLAWAAGSRIIELKTVQVLDELTIPRPCIDAATIGYNVEWSQELRLAESLREYVAGWMLVRILRELDPLGLGAAAALSEPVFELSVGYDLKGLQSVQMHNYLLQAQNVGTLVDELRAQIPEQHKRLRDLDFRSDLVRCVTLSTFHGCPPEEIEAIARYLIDDVGVDVIVKLNPTLLGYDEVLYLLHDRMGYHDLSPKRSAFEGDLKWQEAIALGWRMQEAAARRGRSFGVKMTNTLVVENHKRWLPGDEMYLSGPPLHVLAMHCVERWRAAFGGAVPLSFSGGIDQHNVVDAVACDLVPVTTCTDLLRPGGYGRLGKYLENLEEAMAACGARDRDELVCKRFGKEDEAARLVDGELEEQGARVDAAERRARVVRMAGVLNSHEVAARVTGDPRYAAGKNGKPPRKVGSSLVLLDCLSCDKCVPVCPNDANFSIDTPPEELGYEDVVVDAAGGVTREAGGLWTVKKAQQWANFADACNECGNCDVFCPEDGGPYVMKARYFGSRASFDASPGHDGLWIERAAGELHVYARVAGKPCAMRTSGDEAIVDDGVVRVRYDRRRDAIVEAALVDGARGPHRLSGTVYLTLRTLLRAVLDPQRVNAVSVRLASAPASASASG